MILLLLAMMIPTDNTGYITPDSADMQTWTSRNEQHTCQAKLLRYHVYSRVVCLRSSKGQFFKVYLVTLSDKDREYLESTLDIKIQVDELKATSYGYPCGPFNKDSEAVAYKSNSNPFVGFVKGEKTNVNN